MTSRVRYLTHPQVLVDPATPVPLWGLNAIGHARVAALAEAGWLRGTRRIVTSAERKALETAAPIAAAIELEPIVREAMHENDRSATGFLPLPEFEAVADRFFAQPERSIRGWERAIDAQTRIVREAETILNVNSMGDTLFIGHGAVGTLLYCHYARLPISRTHDQIGGGGQYFSFELSSRRILHAWRPMELPPPI